MKKRNKNRGQAPLGGLAPERGQAKRDYAAIDKKYVWHPFTQMADWEKEEILVIERAEGCYLIDTEGRRYLDGVSSLWCNVHGHRVPEIDRAIKDQLKKVAHSTFLGLSNVPAIELARELVSIAPKGLTRVFYSDSGSEAVEIALKMAYQYWQQKGEKRRQKFARLTNAYHGDTIGAVSVGGIPLFHDLYRPLLFETIEIPSADIQKMEPVFKKHGSEIAALVMEPLIQGAAGMITQPPGTLTKVRALTRSYQILLIFDEVATGFGRTGKMFAADHEKVSPDLMAVAKGLTGGYLPLAATLSTEKIYQGFLGDYSELKTFFHGHTYTANPLACRAALANLKLFREKKILEKLKPKIDDLKTGLLRFRDLPHVGDIRQIGLMAGIELVRDRRAMEPYPLKEKTGIRVIQEARRRGVILRPLGNVIVLMPPLAISRAQLRELIHCTYDSIQAVTGGRKG
ncbi:MAG: adenosylmethionine--8-amino-7-oxononanoate transaminase [Candidatus Omnitrophica bacterium]|nr:adenosylmethionine--8-amino-7-oxononanoate transaminase [Candidatus Omnitrophota bacterium]